MAVRVGWGHMILSLSLGGAGGGVSGRLQRVERQGRSSVPLGLGGDSEDGQEGGDGGRLGGGPLAFGGLSAEV